MWKLAARAALAFGFLLVACAAPDPTFTGSKKSKTPSTKNDDDGSSNDDGSADDPSQPPAKIAFTWKACTGNFQDMSSCGTAKVPLDWSKPDGQQIDLFASRLGSGNARTQLFMVQGGPGASADALVDLAKMVVEQRSDVDVYLVEHRGVGHSTRLTCASAEQQGNIDADQAAGCLADLKKQWGDGVKSFSTTNAAHDLASAVASLRSDGGKAFVYGVSYGTYWAHRMMQVAPSVADGVILDSAVPGSGSRFDEFDTQGDPVLRRMGDVCKRSGTCVANLGSDPTSTMARIINTFDGSRCATALNVGRTWLRGQVFGMLQISQLAALVPSFLFRINRCTAADQQAIITTANAFGGESAIVPRTALPEGDLGSGALYNTVVFSELWTSPAPSQAALKARLASITLSTGGVPLTNGGLEDWVLNMDRKRGSWPTYAKDDFVGKWASTDMPVLVLNGDFDVQTPIEGARLYQTKLTGPGKTFVQIPFGNHGTIFQSVTRDGSACGLHVIVSFLQNPGKPDTSCTTSTVAPDVDVDPDSARFFYKTQTGWGAELADVSAGSELVGDRADMLSPRMKRMLDEIRLADRLRLVPRPTTRLAVRALP